MKRRISEISKVRYGYFEKGVEYLCEPAREEIELAVKENQLEERGYQSHLRELEAEWLTKARTRQECDDLVRIYHARRIAFFVVNGWRDPIVLTADGRMNDGLHRLKAAIFMDLDEVEVTILT